MPSPPKRNPADRLMNSESSRRRMLRRLGALTGLTAVGGPSALLGGCGGGGGGSAPPAVPNDTTPPTVSVTFPTIGATGVALNSSVSATFSETMTNATLNNASFTLATTAPVVAVAGTVVVSGNTATFTPSANLAGSTQYTATITTAARDAAGNALAVNFTWSFTTKPLPRLGAHNLVFNPLGTALNPISTLPMITQASGSTILACVGRGNFAAFSLPMDNIVNSPYVQLDSPHTYTLYPTSGTALYAFQSALGGSGHQVTTVNPGVDEITLAVVEVINGGVIQDVKWSEVLSAPLTSLSVTTTGPATLVAFWWGDAGILSVTAGPEIGWTIVDSQLVAANAVECVVATKDVSAAGTHNITWVAAPAQGAQLWLVAVQ